MRPEIIALIGVLVSSAIGGLVAFLVATLKTSADQKAFKEQIRVQIEKHNREILRERSERKLDIAYKFAELSQKDVNTAALFLNEIAKETAIGFLYLDDDNTRAKIWIRNDANILVGRSDQCDVVLPDIIVSRQHCVIHTEDKIPYVVPLNPTNSVILDNNAISRRTQLNNGTILTIGPYNFVYFEL